MLFYYVIFISIFQFWMTSYWSVRIQVHPCELLLRVKSVFIMWSFLERPWISINLVYGIPWHSWFLAGCLVFLTGSQKPFLQMQSDPLVDPDTLVVCISGHFLHVVFMFLESWYIPRAQAISKCKNQCWKTVHVNEYHTMHYFWNLRCTQSITAYMILTEYFEIFQWKIALWECC